MAVTIDTSFKNKYFENYNLVSQQNKSVLAGLFRYEDMEGEAGFFDYVGKISSSTTGAAYNADTAWIDSVHTRRMVALTRETVAVPVGKTEEMKLINDPTSSILSSAVARMERLKDSYILTAISGTAATGKAGATSTAFDSNMVVTGSGTVTVDNIIDACALLDANDAVMGDRIMVAHPNIKAQLLKIDKVTSSDYTSGVKLDAGVVDMFMGCKIVYTTLAPTSELYIAQSEALVFSMGSGIFGLTNDIRRRNDKNDTMEIFLDMHLGATRLEEEAVAKITL